MMGDRGLVVRGPKVAGSNPVTSTKACQGMSFPNRLFSALCTNSVDYSGLRQFPGETDCERFCRIIADSDLVSGRLWSADEKGRNPMKLAVASSLGRFLSDMGRKNLTICKYRFLTVIQ